MTEKEKTQGLVQQSKSKKEPPYGLSDFLKDAYEAWANPKNYGVKDYTSETKDGKRKKMSFEQAYKKARVGDEEEFMYENRRFNTKSAETTFKQAKKYGNTNELDSKTINIIKKAADQGQWENPMNKEQIFKKLLKLSELSGNPSISENPQWFLKMNGQTGRPSFNPFKNEISTPEEEYVFQDLLSEYPHAYAKKQENQGPLDFVKDFIKNPFFSKESQAKIYDKSGTLEYDAHSVIEPIMEQYFNGEIEEKDVQPMIDFTRKVYDHYPKSDTHNYQPTAERARNILNSMGYGLSAKIEKSTNGKLSDQMKSAMKDFTTKVSKGEQPGRNKKEIDSENKTVAYNSGAGGSSMKELPNLELYKSLINKDKDREKQTAISKIKPKGLAAGNTEVLSAGELVKKPTEKPITNTTPMKPKTNPAKSHNYPTDFSLFMPSLKQLEGGYQNDKADNGNKNSLGQIVGTNRGISARTYEGIIGRPPTVEDMKAITPKIARKIYKDDYWNKNRASEIKSQAVANVIIDHQVNSGQGIQVLQKTLNKKFGYNIDVDNKMGQDTLNALNSVDPRKFVNTYVQGRIDHYEKIGQKEYVEQWKERAKKFTYNSNESYYRIKEGDTQKVQSSKEAAVARLERLDDYSKREKEIAAMDDDESIDGKSKEGMRRELWVEAARNGDKDLIERMHKKENDRIKADREKLISDRIQEKQKNDPRGNNKPVSESTVVKNKNSHSPKLKGDKPDLDADLAAWNKKNPGKTKPTEVKDLLVTDVDEIKTEEYFSKIDWTDIDEEVARTTPAGNEKETSTENAAEAGETEDTPEEAAAKAADGKINDADTFFKTEKGLLAADVKGMKDKPSYDKKDYKQELPMDAVAGLALGLIGNNEAKNANIPLRSEDVGQTIKMYIAELAKRSKDGLPPEVEAAMKNQLAEAYQGGLRSIVNASGGNRATVLGNLGQLEVAKNKGVVSAQIADYEAKERAFEQYGRAIEYADKTKLNRDIANTTLRQQQGLLAQSEGKELAAAGFEKLTEELAYQKENGPGSVNHMARSSVMQSIFGFDPSKKDDGTGDPGTKSRFDMDKAAAVGEKTKVAEYNKKYLNLNEETRTAIGEKYTTTPDEDALYRNIDEASPSSTSPTGLAGAQEAQRILPEQEIAKTPAAPSNAVQSTEAAMVSATPKVSIIPATTPSGIKPQPAAGLAGGVMPPQPLVKPEKAALGLENLAAYNDNYEQYMQNQ